MGDFRLFRTGEASGTPGQNTKGVLDWAVEVDSDTRYVSGILSPGDNNSENDWRRLIDVMFCGRIDN